MGEQNTGRTSDRRVRYSIFIAAVAAAFIGAFVLAWLLFSPPPQPPPAPAPAVRTLTEDDLREFLRAADVPDYGRMRDLGRELFQEGNIIPGSGDLFAEYETTSYVPHVVYAFHTLISQEKTQRVLLTMTEGDKVVSFLAEEMLVNQ